MNWTVEQLLGEIAGILVSLENGNDKRAREMAELIVGDTDYHAHAFEEYVEEFGEDDLPFTDELVEDFLDGKDVSGE